MGAPCWINVKGQRLLYSKAKVIKWINSGDIVPFLPPFRWKVRKDVTRLKGPGFGHGITEYNPLFDQVRMGNITAIKE
jgi:hypothetical protein